MKYNNIREEELKNKVSKDWFWEYDTTEILGNIDFTVYPKQDSLFGGRTVLLWAEAKTGDYDIVTMFVQLILTIGKARAFDKTLPPTFLGAFDFKKIAFIPYDYVQDIFYENDFNWNVTPSNHNTKEFGIIKERIETHLQKNVYIFDYKQQGKDLKDFIKNNIAKSSTSSKIKIDKNNFIPIYLRWLEVIKPIININWDDLQSANISDNDFFLADLFVDDKGTQKIDDDSSIRDNLFVVFENQGYKIAKENISAMFDATISITNKDIYQGFWKSYKRPPIKQYRDYIIERRDLLVPQDIRERKGAFFTPRKRVELSQKYIADYLGSNWQDDYYIWDCAAGTGNLLAGLTNKYNIYASTLDQADVNVMHERIDHGATLLKKHVFQFDFLNDDFTKLPQSLQDIINDPEKSKKLIIYINPPYAEAASMSTISSGGANKKNVAVTSDVYSKYKNEIGIGGRELFVQFLTRIYAEIPNSKIAEFSKLKILQAPNFGAFREFFLAKLEKLFIVPANTFDNVKGKFPIGFFLWNTEIKERFSEIVTDIYDSKEGYIGSKAIVDTSDLQSINDWLITSRNRKGEKNIGYLSAKGCDFQNINTIFIINKKTQLPHPRGTQITDKNIIEIGIYFAVRHCIDATWLNDRDQFLHPVNSWKDDIVFHNDCLAFMLFYGQNRISIEEGTNHWIPFSEEEVDSGERFESHFMKDFIDGKLPVDENTELELLDGEEEVKLYDGKAREFSQEAINVFDAGRELWKYYHSQGGVNVNGSFYDIRTHFQGKNAAGRMNSKSEDKKYSELIAELRNSLSVLAEKIQPKVYEYEFLKK